MVDRGRRTAQQPFGRALGVHAPRIHPIARSAAAPSAGPLPLGARIAFFGDSIGQQDAVGFTAGNTTIGLTAQTSDAGELGQCYAKDPRFNCDIWPDASDSRGTSGFLRYIGGSNRGISGENSTEMLARFATELATLNCAIVVINIGINDKNGVNNIAIGTTQSNTAAIVAAALAAGKKVILGTPRPNINGTYTVDTAAMWAWAQATYAGNPNVILWGAYPLLLADGPLAIDFRDSTLHPGHYGAQATALGNDLSVPSNSLLGCIRQLVTAGNILTSDHFARATPSLNPTLTGVGGTKATFTGTVPDSWSLIRNSGAFTGVASNEANADTGGNSVVLTITPSGVGTNEEWRFQPITALSGAAATALQSKWLSFIAEVETDNNPIFGTIYGALTCSDANYIGRAMQVSTATSNAASRQNRPYANRYFIRTPPILMPASLTTVNFSLFGVVQSANGASPGVAKIHRARLIEYGDPRPAWAP